MNKKLELIQEIVMLYSKLRHEQNNNNLEIEKLQASNKVLNEMIWKLQSIIDDHKEEKNDN